MKLYNIPQPFGGVSSAEITMADGTTRIEKYAVFYPQDCGSVAIYESEDCYAKRKETLYLCDDAIESIRWFETDGDKVIDINTLLNSKKGGYNFNIPAPFKPPEWKYEPTDAKCSGPAFSGG